MAHSPLELTSDEEEDWDEVWTESDASGEDHNYEDAEDLRGWIVTEAEMKEKCQEDPEYFDRPPIDFTSEQVQEWYQNLKAWKEHKKLDRFLSIQLNKKRTIERCEEQITWKRGLSDLRVNEKQKVRECKRMKKK